MTSTKSRATKKTAVTTINPTTLIPVSSGYTIAETMGRSVNGVSLRDHFRNETIITNAIASTARKSDPTRRAVITVTTHADTDAPILYVDATATAAASLVTLGDQITRNGRNDDRVFLVKLLIAHAAINRVSVGVSAVELLKNHHMGKLASLKWYTPTIARLLSDVKNPDHWIKCMIPGVVSSQQLWVSTLDAADTCDACGTMPCTDHALFIGWDSARSQPFYAIDPIWYKLVINQQMISDKLARIHPEHLTADIMAAFRRLDVSGDQRGFLSQLHFDSRLHNGSGTPRNANANTLRWMLDRANLAAVTHAVVKH